jgi:predicted Zn-dependent protease with MMP-like domain
MAQMTITEALAELKTIDRRLAKKREFVLTYLLRQEAFKDPLEKDGGSVSAIKRETQAIGDLEERKVVIRRAIQQANEKNTVTLGKQIRTIADWLVWRREVVPQQQQFLTNMRTKIEQARQEALRKGANLTTAVENAKPNDVIVNINEQELAKEIEELEEILGKLDGQLSLKNATLFVEV